MGLLFAGTGGHTQEAETDWRGETEIGGLDRDRDWTSRIGDWTTLTGIGEGKSKTITLTWEGM
jgi:hypothetical protein